MKFSLLILIAVGLVVECQLLGGITKVDDLKDEYLLKATSHFVDDKNSKSNDLHLSKLVEVLEANQQTVSGMRYYIKLKIQKTICSKNAIETVLEDCELDTNSAPQYCTVDIWVQWWNKIKPFTVNDECCSGNESACNLPNFENRGAASRKLQSFENTNNAQDYFRKNDQSQPSINFFENEDLKYIDDFESFKKKYNKIYDTDEENKKRYLVFSDNVARAHKFQEIEQGTAKYGVTKFMDLTEAEFKKYYLSPIWKPTQSGLEATPAVIPDIKIPDSFDWRDKGAVTPVKNQGMCGSCWAFSTTGNIEGQVFLNNGTLLSLSEQELVDCDKVDEGCNGGLPSTAYEQIIKLGGLMSESDYPYKGYDDTCHFSKADVAAQISGYVNVSQNETDIAKFLVANGPISIGINANAMQFYFGGISHPWKIFCSPESLDHGVLIVGYGTEDSTPYWIIKNSWGASWGEEGYYRVFRGDGVCGLNMMCTSAFIN